jgi:hypothetical protein
MHESEPECHREETLMYDNRREKEKSCFRPDFLIRKKGWRTDTYAMLEIKQAPSPTTCMNNLLSDIKKISKIKPSALFVRTLLGLAIFKADKETFDLNDYFESVEAIFTAHEYMPIGNTGFMYLLFSS